MIINNSVKLKLSVIFVFALGALMLNDFGRIEIKAASPLPENSDISLNTTITDSDNNNTTDPTKLNLNLIPSNSEVISSGKLTALVTANNPSGDKLSLKADSDTLNDGSGHTIASAAGTTTSPAKLTTNTWGFAVPKIQGDQASLQNTAFDASYSITESTNLSSSNSKFASLPLADYLIRDTTASTVTNSASATTDIFLASAINNSQISGSYSASLTLTAVNNPLPTPTITSISPNTGPLAGGTVITVTGANFTTNTQVYIDLDKDGAQDIGEECVISSGTLADNSLTCSTPVATSGTYDVVVITGGGKTKTTAGTTSTTNDDFTYAWNCPYNSNTLSFTEINIELDGCMVPIKYTGSTTSPEWQVADQTNTNSDWFNYDTQKWANAVTLTQSAIESHKYKESNGTLKENTVVAEEDILGYFTYIPRYAYEVQRYHAWNKPVCGNNQTGINYADADCTSSGYQASFAIQFEKPSTAKKTASPGTCNTAPPSAVAALGYTNGTDYRTGCGVSRSYGDATGTTWQTHPAFTLAGQELPGIWVGKYETSTPTLFADRAAANSAAITGDIFIKPNQYGFNYQYIGDQFTTAKNMSTNPDGITGGNILTSAQTNTQNLSSSAQTMQMNNNHWGAIAYLSASQYGKQLPVYINNCYKSGTPTNYNGRTGWGAAGQNTSSTTSCAVGTTDIGAYHMTQGQQASTTGNVYGIYDMSGDNYEYVMAYKGANNSTTYMANPLPSDNYMNNYGFTSALKPDWSYSTSEYWYNFDRCNYAICGGQANYESTFVQSVSGYDQSWGSDYSSFVYSSNPWVRRGGNANSGSLAGLFYSYITNGYANSYYGFRVVLW